MRTIDTMAIHMAGKDIDATQQYIRLALRTLEHGERVLAEAIAQHPDCRELADTLQYKLDQTRALVRELKRTADSAECIDAQTLKTFAPDALAVAS